MADLRFDQVNVVVPDIPGAARFLRALGAEVDVPGAEWAEWASSPCSASGGRGEVRCRPRQPRLCGPLGRVARRLRRCRHQSSNGGSQLGRCRIRTGSRTRSAGPASSVRRLLGSPICRRTRSRSHRRRVDEPGRSGGKDRRTGRIRLRLNPPSARSAGQWRCDSWPCSALRKPSMSVEWNTTRLLVAT